MIYGFTAEELEHGTNHVALTMGRRNLAVLDAVRHHRLFINATPDEQHSLEEAVMKAFESVAVPDLRRVLLP